MIVGGGAAAGEAVGEDEAGGDGRVGKVFKLVDDFTNGGGRDDEEEPGGGEMPWGEGGRQAEGARAADGLVNEAEGGRGGWRVGHGGIDLER